LQIASLIPKISLSAITPDTAFAFTKDGKTSVLFDPSKVEEWIEELEDNIEVENLYVFSDRQTYDVIKSKIVDVLEPLLVEEELKRPLRDGFLVNAEYFKLEFLEKDDISLGRRLKEILPLLWIRAGAKGPRPEITLRDVKNGMIIPQENNFAVLLDESYFPEFIKQIKSKSNIVIIFLVTDSEEAFIEMGQVLNAYNTIQLYRDYLENFMINKDEK